MYFSPDTDQQINNQVMDDKTSRLQSRIESARRENTRRSSHRDSLKVVAKKRPSDTSTTLGSSTSHLDPHAIIDLLETSAQDDRDGSYRFLQIIKNSPMDASAKPMNRSSAQGSSGRRGVSRKTTSDLARSHQDHQHTWLIYMTWHQIQKRWNRHIDILTIPYRRVKVVLSYIHTITTVT